MIHCKRTDATHEDFCRLVAALDADLAIRDGAEHGFYAQYNKTDRIRHVVLAYQGDEAAGCGAVKEYAPGIMEVKRMYVPPAKRGMGIASGVLQELERWCREMHYKKCILETGKKQPEAIALYLKSGYAITANYGQYAGVENSVCFEKLLF
jgi:GNAT superfamily N-acetyltransferase